jgi:hypothetical protein
MNWVALLLVIVLARTWEMLSGLLKSRHVIEYMYGNMSTSSHLMTRQPNPTEWEVADTVEGALKDLCSIVTKTQARNSH